MLNGDLGLVCGVKVAAVAVSGFAFFQVGGIGVEPKVHLGSFVLNAGIRMSGGIVEEVVYSELDVGPGAGGY